LTINKGLAELADKQSQPDYTRQRAAGGGRKKKKAQFSNNSLATMILMPLDLTAISPIPAEEKSNANNSMQEDSFANHKTTQTSSPDSISHSDQKLA
jgi:hypothetical protein